MSNEPQYYFTTIAAEIQSIQQSTQNCLFSVEGTPPCPIMGGDPGSTCIDRRWLTADR